MGKIYQSTGNSSTDSRISKGQIVSISDCFFRYRARCWFRVELWQIAKKLGLTGFAENLPNGDVHAQIQGPNNKIMYVITYMKSIPRIHIDKMEIEEMEWIEEKGFEALY